MSVEKREPAKMPQPEQWLSEHLWAFPLIVVAFALIVWWLSDL